MKILRRFKFGSRQIKKGMGRGGAENPKKKNKKEIKKRIRNRKTRDM